jgi:hypothetical protein
VPLRLEFHPTRPDHGRQVGLALDALDFLLGDHWHGWAFVLERMVKPVFKVSLDF